MELRTIISFLKAAELHNFTHAAASLGYTQSTVTVQMRQLEEELGFRLFDRIGKNVALTAKGEEFLPYANQIAATAQKALALGTETASPRGNLRIGIVESLFTNVFLPVMPVFHHENPEVRIATKIAGGTDLLRLLRQNEVDVIFLLGKKLFEPDCVRAFEREFGVSFLAAADSDFVSEKPRRFKDIIKLPLMLTERSSVYRRLLEEEAAARDLEFQPFMEVDNTTALLRLVKTGIGISFLPSYVLRNEENVRDLTVLPVSDLSPTMWCQILYHKNKWLTPQMESFISLIEKSFADAEL